MNTRKIEHAFSSEIKIFPVPLRTRNGESDRSKDFTDDSGTREKEKENEKEAKGIVSRRARVVDGNCELMISEKGRASTAWRCCYYWNETDGRKTEWRERERRRVVCRTSAGLVSAAAGGQTGCPDSTEGRLLCLPRVAREKQTRTRHFGPRPYLLLDGKEREREREKTVQQRARDNDLLYPFSLNRGSFERRIFTNTWQLTRASSMKKKQEKERRRRRRRIHVYRIESSVVLEAEKIRIDVGFLACRRELLYYARDSRLYR